MGLKREVNDLLARLGQPPRYSGLGEQAGTAEAPKT